MTSSSYRMLNASQRVGRLTQRRILVSVLTIALYTATIGCHNSSTSAEAMLAASTTPAALVQAPVVTPTPAKTIQVNPPATFGADQLPTGAVVAFEIPASAGEFLRVKTVGLYRLSVRSPRDGAALEPGGDSSGWLYSFPQTGTYRALFSTESDPAIEFSFLDPGDPLVDPGINPAAVSIETDGLAHGIQLNVIPYRVNEDEDFQNSWPTHVGLQNPHFELHIMSIAAYKKIFQAYERITALQAAIQEKGNGVALKKLPYPAYRQGGLNVSSRPVLLETDGWRGLRWIGGFGQDSNCRLPLAGQKLGYIFEGISNDGRYFILLRASISHNTSRPAATQHCLIEVGHDLTAAPPDSYHPNLDQLDAVVRSLKIEILK